jgi:hypothetical protein
MRKHEGISGISISLFLWGHDKVFVMGPKQVGFFPEAWSYFHQVVETWIA